MLAHPLKLQVIWHSVEQGLVAGAGLGRIFGYSVGVWLALLGVLEH